MIAVLLSLGAAITFALSAMFISATGGRVQVFQLARWQMGLAMPALIAVSLWTGGWARVEGWQFALLAGSSAVGIMFATSTYLAAIVAAGPRVTAVLFSLASPFAVALGWLFLDETLSPGQLGGIGLILAGIVLAVLAERGGDAGGQGKLWLGIGLGVLTSIGQASGSLLARPAMAAGVEPATAMAIRAGLGWLFFLALLVLPSARALPWPKRRDIGLVGWSSLTGMVIGMSLMMGALATGEIGIVATLTSTTPILILPMVWASSGKVPPALAWIGAALAVAGTAMISLAS